MASVVARVLARRANIAHLELVKEEKARLAVLYKQNALSEEFLRLRVEKFFHVPREYLRRMELEKDYAPREVVQEVVGRLFVTLGLPNPPPRASLEALVDLVLEDGLKLGYGPESEDVPAPLWMLRYDPESKDSPVSFWTLVYVPSKHKMVMDENGWLSDFIGRLEEAAVKCDKDGWSSMSTFRYGSQQASSNEKTILARIETTLTRVNTGFTFSIDEHNTRFRVADKEDEQKPSERGDDSPAYTDVATPGQLQ